MECPTGKKVLNKKGAQTMRNRIMEIEHIRMRIYQCLDCNYWHLATIGKSKPFKGLINNHFYEKLYGKKNKKRRE